MRASDLSRSHKGAAVWLFSLILSGPVLAAVTEQLNESSNKASRYKETITTLAVAAKHLLRQNATEASTAKVDEYIGNSKQGSVAPWDFSQQFRDLTLRRSNVYNGQMLQGFIVEGVHLSIRSPMRRWYVDS